MESLVPCTPEWTGQLSHIQLAVAYKGTFPNVESLCLNVVFLCVSMAMCMLGAVPAESRRGPGFLWSWSYRRLGVASLGPWELNWASLGEQPVF